MPRLNRLSGLVRFTMLKRTLTGGTCVVDCWIVGLLEWKDVRVDISMMVSCYASAIVEYDRRRSGLPCAPLIMGYDNNSIE